MKIRILGNTIRFRLKQPEVDQFKKDGKVTEVIAFGARLEDQLCFSLALSSEPDLAISFQANTTTVHVPQALAEKWTSTDLVGFNGRLDTGKGQEVEVLVEKDFACLDAPEADNEGTYPNPKAAC
ncbi:hypothetical protein CLV24_104132 [Pontibacter ummariensis]|uniref:Uncharacterized protein n=1 Tax=Pontibacter ummariensis TaxID=1610492 RepID=A0A239DBT7_9BACT|nr:hypothetical protein [Pontibacter ummariensis]PRY14322.1 hypothetical protein CLV24_104132 [Pontibacter ummariensis]SNS29153.1 hypothetical protein SAMN06296052_104131 [Pontibacter ummariensis]